MNYGQRLLKTFGAITLILSLGMSMDASAGLFGIAGDSWKEQVLLHDGQKIVVERSVERGGRHEIGQKPPYKEQRLSFSLPGAGRSITWEDHFSEDLGSANFLPMLLDVHNSTPYIVVSPMGCLSYNKWGRPNPPYVIFKHDGKEWRRIPIQELPVEIKTPNLIFSAPDIVVEKMGKSFIAAETIQQIVNDYKQPEYRTILREPTNSMKQGCIKTDYYGKAGWLSPDWFTDQPSLEACLRFCDSKKIDTDHCPCHSVFKGK